MTSQPFSPPGGTQNDSNNFHKEWQSEHSMNRPRPSAPALDVLSEEAPPPSYEEAIAPSYQNYVTNKEKYEKH